MTSKDARETATASGNPVRTHELPKPMDVAICDAHHHLFENPSHRYTLEDSRQDTAGLPVVKSIYVECGEHYRSHGPADVRPVGETTWVADLSDDGLIAGIIEYADLTLPNISDILAAHIVAGQGRLRGGKASNGVGRRPQHFHASHDDTSRHAR